VHAGALGGEKLPWVLVSQEQPAFRDRSTATSTAGAAALAHACAALAFPAAGDLPVMSPPAPCPDHVTLLKLGRGCAFTLPLAMLGRVGSDGATFVTVAVKVTGPGLASGTL
jgi:hypothetical protein